MFSGIVEAVSPVLSQSVELGIWRLQVQRPSDFDGVKIGDSISVNGVCLTLESVEPRSLGFALGAETLKVLGLDFSKDLTGRRFNLERSLCLGERVHGHLVTGHVDSLGFVVQRKFQGGSLLLGIQVNKNLSPYIWRKGCLAINGVSLTINEINDNIVNVCLIPETQKRTNLADLQPGDEVTVEPDYFVKAMIHFISQESLKKINEK